MILKMRFMRKFEILFTADKYRPGRIFVVNFWLKQNKSGFNIWP